MLRFLSGRSRRKNNIDGSHSLRKKQLDCRIILLDGTDLSVDLTVSVCSSSIIFVENKIVIYVCVV